MHRSFERWYPVAAGSLLAIMSAVLSSHQKVMVATELANPIINILAITFGFLAAALAVLLTAQDIPAIKRLKQTNHFRYLMEYLWASVNLSFFSAILSLAALIVCKSVDAPGRKLTFYVWAFLVGWALAAFFRVIYLLVHLLQPPAIKPAVIQPPVAPQTDAHPS